MDKPSWAKTKKMGRPRIRNEIEKKRLKQMHNRKSQMSRITIGDQMPRWEEVILENNLINNRDVAKFLLDRFHAYKKLEKTAARNESTSSVSGFLPNESSQLLVSDESTSSLNFNADANITSLSVASSLDCGSAVHNIPSVSNVSSARLGHGLAVHNLPSVSCVSSARLDHDPALHNIPSVSDVSSARLDHDPALHNIPSVSGVSSARLDYSSAVHNIPSVSDVSSARLDHSSAVHNIPSVSGVSSARQDCDPTVHNIPSVSGVSSARQDCDPAVHNIRSVSGVSSARRDLNPAVHNVPSVSGVLPAKLECRPAVSEVVMSGESLQSPEAKSRHFEKFVKNPEKWTDSFSDPFNLSINISKEESTSREDRGSDCDDSDLESGFEITAVLPDEVNYIAEEVPYEEAIFGFESPGCDGIIESDTDKRWVPPTLTTVKDEDDCNDITSSITCIVFVKEILNLAKTNVPFCTVPGCHRPTAINESYQGSALYLKWECDAGHTCHQWCSQPLLNRSLHSGDFLISGSILTSGNNYSKMALWAEMLSLKFPSADQFYKISRSYMIPTIDQFWTDHQRDLLESFREKDVVVLGDIRDDSTDHSIYTVMENETKKVLAICTLDKQMTDRKAGSKQKLGLKTSLQELKEKRLNIVEVVTKAHQETSEMMNCHLVETRENNTSVLRRFRGLDLAEAHYPSIFHSYDIWHVAKNLGKRIMKVALKKGNGKLKGWCQEIINHFWFACKKSETYQQFIVIWRSVLYHITNSHEWTLPCGGVGKCLHEPLTNGETNKPWLSPFAHAHVLKDLTAVVLNKKLLNNVKYYLNFRSTAELEGFGNHVDMYCPKGYSYTLSAYTARNTLAALDHNMNIDRTLACSDSGLIRYHRVFNRNSKRWSVHPVKTRKHYTYIKTILCNALKMRISDKRGMWKTALKITDPETISKHFASKLQDTALQQKVPQPTKGEQSKQQSSVQKPPVQPSSVAQPTFPPSSTVIQKIALVLQNKMQPPSVVQPTVQPSQIAQQTAHLLQAQVQPSSDVQPSFSSLTEQRKELAKLSQNQVEQHPVVQPDFISPTAEQTVLATLSQNQVQQPSVIQPNISPQQMVLPHLSQNQPQLFSVVHTKLPPSLTLQQVLSHLPQNQIQPPSITEPPVTQTFVPSHQVMPPSVVQSALFSPPVIRQPGTQFLVLAPTVQPAVSQDPSSQTPEIHPVVLSPLVLHSLSPETLMLQPAVSQNSNEEDMDVKPCIQDTDIKKEVP